VLFLRKWNFSVLRAKSTKICSVFISFDHQTVTNEQKKCPIPNQHKKLRQLTYVSPKIISPLKHTCGGPQGFFQKSGLRGSTGDFSWKIILVKYMLVDVVFCADSEYDICFARL
jgi:hypothetical protein